MRTRRLHAIACALCLAALLALAGTPALAASTGLGSSGALSKLTEEPEQTETTSTATTASTSSEPHNSDTVLVLGLGAAVVLLGGIAFMIMRDARRFAPAADVDLLEGGSSARHTQAALRKRRARAKAARQQRKRNR